MNLYLLGFALLYPALKAASKLRFSRFVVPTLRVDILSTYSGVQFYGPLQLTADESDGVCRDEDAER
ncbi:hypothetical protein ACH518_06870 [Methylomonas sp. HW2-6]|uniref:hypothetical protein n=1 Tax=Methylomonas sp. HW2-6 TaxID=3376687 RepID=UPI00404101FC